MSEMHDPYEDQLAAARYRAERDQARQELARLRSEATTVSAYDLLTEEDREALRWVRAHGGLERIKVQRRESIPRAAYERKKAGFLGHIAECERALGRRRDVITKLANENDALRLELAQMRSRLMPEGMEWPTVDGKPVVIGERLVGYGSGDDGYEVVGVRPTCGWVLVKLCDHIHRDGGPVILEWDASKCHRPAPKVLDADGVEIRVGDTVWDVDGSGPFIASGFVGEPLAVIFEIAECNDLPRKPSQLTHRAPVLDADGKPLREGEHVYHVETCAELVVKKLPKPGEYQAVVVFALPTSPASHLTSFDPDQLTHERPVADTWQRIEEDAYKDDCEYFGRDLNGCEGCPASRQDIDNFYCDENEKASDLVRRARALAERDR